MFVQLCRHIMIKPDYGKMHKPSGRYTYRHLIIRRQSIFCFETQTFNYIHCFQRTYKNMHKTILLCVTIRVNYECVFILFLLWLF